MSKQPVDNEKKFKPNRKRNSRLLMLGGGCLILVAPFLLTRDWSGIAFTETGDIGDTIGGITSPIVGLLGAILVYYALLEQIEANRLINEQFNEQKAMTVQQNFENTFFSMLNIHHEIVNNIKFNSNDLILHIDKKKGKIDPKSQKEIIGFNEAYGYDSTSEESADGRKFFQYTTEAFIDTLGVYDIHCSNEYAPNWQEYKNQLTGEEFKSYFWSIYSEFYIKLDTHLGHYFRNLYRIIKMVDEQPFYLSKEEEFKKKYFYTSIVRSQLSDYEIIWLFYNGLYEYGNEKFKPLMEKYTLLKNLIDPDEDEITKFKIGRAS